jgi:hypothetical protein
MMTMKKTISTVVFFLVSVFLLTSCRKTISAAHFEVNCTPDSVKIDTAVLLVMGQSNAANFGETKYTAACSNSLNFYSGVLYPLADPLKGATGNGGSVWSRLADILITKGLARVVIIAPVSIGGTSIETWKPGGINNHLIIETVTSLQSKGLRITHVLWHQGESDNTIQFPLLSDADNAQRYRNEFLQIVAQLRSLGVHAPVFPAQATRCNTTPPDLLLQQAQHDLASDSLGIYNGPNTDLLGNEYRFDRCHFNDLGLHVHAMLWADILYAH